MKAVVQISNPLPSALTRYEDELYETFERVGIEWGKAEAWPVEGLRGVSGRVRMLNNAILNLKNESQSKSTTLTLWPSLGLLSSRSWLPSKSRNAVVLHDPVPLRKQVGFGPFTKILVRTNNPHRSPLIVSHSRDALAVARRLLPRNKHALALHPILNRQQNIPKTPEPSVVVAGQYKPQRDLLLLSELGPRLRKRGIKCIIYGRGWPKVEGWEIVNRFLTEEELDHALGSAWLVLLPYRFYFQSGIAIRALELGTFTISPPTSFASDVLGPNGVVANSDSIGSWEESIYREIEYGDNLSALFRRYRELVDESWLQLNEAYFLSNGGL